MLNEMRTLLEADDYREALAEAAYMRQRTEEAAVAAEHDDPSEDEAIEFFVLAWPHLSDTAKRPYRTAVAEVLDNVLALPV